MVSAGSVSLSQPWLEDGSAYWQEGRPAEGGRSVLMRGGPFSDPVELTPKGFNVRTTAHEYGGGAYLIHRGTAFFSNFADQRLYRQDPGADPVPITPGSAGRDRYADGRVTPDGRWLICVRERHPDPDDPSGVTNELVAVPPDGSAEPVAIRSGHDFYSTPRISPDGSMLCWLEWDLPWMPWDGCEVFVAELAGDNTVENARQVAGRAGEESIFQPAWSPAGDLHFVSDRTGWWNLYREREGRVQALHPAEVEFGWPQWLFGMSAYGFVGDGRIACLWERDGVQHLAILDPESGELIDLDVPHSAMWPDLDVEGDSVAFVGGGPSIPDQVVLLDVTARSMDVLRSSSSMDVDEGYHSIPRQVEFPTEGGVTAFAHFYPPRNLDATGPADERPPLIVKSHGGPTAEATPSFHLETQFWTSRGFAVVDVNYGGSTGYGRAYRERLHESWGVVDVEDCAHAALFLAQEGLADSARLVATGGSAGGYTTLCLLTFRDEFAAGASHYGIGDLEGLARDTHKFEAHYTDWLVGPWPGASARYRERSPIHHAARLRRPVIFFQGLEDRVVPPAQAEAMAGALAARGVRHATVFFPDEGHGFRRADNIRRALEAELWFYGRVLGFPVDSTPDPAPVLR
ncbi:MAG: prolyl oligopeptidase family serine peptidase [Actinomycetota bacterium]|nr:prolyl oligopeptidase family serine peptidase [Actinomycetota bacterium]